MAEDARADGGGQRYWFGPLSRRGLVAGFRGGQLAALGLGALLAVTVLRADPALPGVVGALGLLGLGAAAGTVPLAGRTAEEWAPDALRHAAGRLRGWRPRADLGRRFALAETQAPGRSPGRADRVGVVVDRARGVLSVVLPVEGDGLVLRGPEEQDQQVARWARVLGAAGRDLGGVHRLQWLASCGPLSRADLARLCRTDVAEPGAPPGRTAGHAGEEREGPAEAYRALVASWAPTLVRHEVHLAVSVRSQARHLGSWLGGLLGARDGTQEALARLARELDALRERLAEAGARPGPPLDRAALARWLAGTSRPSSDDRAGAATGWPWPDAVRADWDCLRTDGTWQATWWVAEWPRQAVPAGFLVPLLVPSRWRQRLVVVLAPLGPTEARRQAERARTADLADAELRQRSGFLRTARRRREEQAVWDRERELAEGHAACRFAGYLTICADDRPALEAAAEELEQRAARTGLELRRCYGDQLEAWLATWPTGDGLP
ncbi:SCO6880 family protein [Aciditerrimonas ferrireducens]|uniref:SCO6880 family protein n=1 Tax=Aciditerrimonas ferrireducens TaxID=667306 RepID=UPI00200607CD|nr:SCO6880 family protein [Aciditerrimonas ferrireducens]MCK4177549.1 hypothetical protein [Aciditerrimonas ferrireducens]